MKTQTISKTKAIELIKATKGRFFGITFVKKDGVTRTMCAQYSSQYEISPLGYIKLNDRNDKNTLKNVNLQTIREIKIGGVTRKIAK